MIHLLLRVRQSVSGQLPPYYSVVVHWSFAAAAVVGYSVVAVVPAAAVVAVGSVAVRHDYFVDFDFVMWVDYVPRYHLFPRTWQHLCVMYVMAAPTRPRQRRATLP